MSPLCYVLYASSCEKRLSWILCVPQDYDLSAQDGPDPVVYPANAQDGPVVYPANAFDSYLRGDSVQLEVRQNLKQNAQNK